MSRLALLVVGMLVGAALVLVPIERGWLHSDEVRALFHPGAGHARGNAPPTAAPPTTSAPTVVQDTAPFGAAAPQPLPPTCPRN